MHRQVNCMAFDFIIGLAITMAISGCGPSETSAKYEGALFHAMEKGKIVFINNEGKVIYRLDGVGGTKPPPSMIPIQGIDGKAGFVDSSGQRFFDGVAWIRDPEVLKFRAKLIDAQGRELFSISTIHRFSDGRSPVVLSHGDFSEGLAKMSVVIESVKPLDLPTKIGFIDKTGKMVIDAQFDNASDFRNGTAWVAHSDGRRGLIDKTGKLLTPPDIKCFSNLSEGLIVAENRKGSGYIDISGKWVIEPRFHIAGEFTEGMAPVAISLEEGREKKLRFGYIDKTGKFVIEPTFDASSAQSFSEGRAAIYMNVPGGPSRWGYIKRDGTFIVKPTLSDARAFHKGLAWCHEPGRLPMYVNVDGKVVWTNSGP